MLWSDIFLSLRGALATKQSQSGYGKFVYPREKYVWVQVRILHETDKAVLVDTGTKIWIPKSRIHRIRLQNNTLQIHVKENIAG